jgi:hypothetical protein
MGVCASLYAQDPGGGQTGTMSNGVESEQKTVSAVVRRGGVQSQVKAFFKELERQDGVKMKAGVNKRPQQEGDDFFVAVGVAEISAHRSSKDWATSRAVAFEKAMNQAKDQLLTFVVSDIETTTRQTLEENTSGIAPAAQSEGQGVEGGKQPSVVDKVVKLTHNKLDEMLDKQGKQSNSAAAAQPSRTEVDKLMRTEEFQNFVRTSGRAVVAGMQTFQTFEDLQSGRNGEVAVIGIVSEKTLALAASVGCGAPLPRGKVGKPIDEQVPDADNEAGALQLLNTFGVRTMYDQNGDLVLVSFNQACPVNNSTGAELSAQRRAGAFAAGEMRKFLGEQIARVEDVFRSETIKDFEGNTRETEAKEGSRYAYEARAEKIAITGIAPVRDWVAKHPVTGQIVVGSVKMWLPSGKAFAGVLRGKMAIAAAEAASSSPREAVQAASTGGRKQINSDQEGNFKGRGVKGDKSGF